MSRWHPLPRRGRIAAFFLMKSARYKSHPESQESEMQAIHDKGRRSRAGLALLLLAALLAQPAAAKRYPAHVFTPDVNEGEVLLVEKATRTAYLLDIKPLPETRRAFKGLMLGENDGRKYHVGDKRTPEGIYKVTTFLPDEVLDARYGSGAFPLDYPNPIDRLKGRNGSGIWLHGRDDNDKDKQATLGCVAFANHDIRALRQMIAPQTPVVITSKADFVDPDTYQRERERILGVLDRFLQAWEKGDFEQLDALIDPAFRGADGLDKRRWLARKKRIFQHQRQRTIKADHIVALRENHEQVVFDFTQSYCAANINSRGRKRLFFQKAGDGLRLISEEYRPLPPEPLPQEKVIPFVKRWLAAWNQRDLDGYVNSYAESFRDSKGRDIRAFRAFKKIIFGRRPDHRISAENLRVERLGPARFKVSFVQHYRSGELNDTGRKTLIVSGCGDRLWIEQEAWSRL